MYAWPKPIPEMTPEARTKFVFGAVSELDQLLEDIEMDIRSEQGVFKDLKKQGGTGALLFNPVYQDNNSDDGGFWGFVILVIDWNRFIGGCHRIFLCR